MKNLEINNMIAKVKQGEELSDLNYLQLIDYECKRLQSDRINDIVKITTDMYVGYKKLKKLGEYIKNDFPYLETSCDFMCVAILKNKINYIFGENDKEIACKTLCRYNTLNYIKEIDEILNYTDLMFELDEVIRYYLNMSYTLFENDIAKEEIDALENSAKKMLTISKNYF